MSPYAAAIAWERNGATFTDNRGGSEPLSKSLDLFLPGAHALPTGENQVPHTEGDLRNWVNEST